MVTSPYDCHAKAHAGEPTFTLLGRDPQAASLIRQWAWAREQLGEYPEKVAEARRIADAMDKYRKDTEPPRRQKVVAVIGHGKSPVGRGWGALIDSSDVVIRMWDWHWQNPADYGFKYDYGLFEIAQGLIVDLFNKHNERTPSVAFLGSKLKPFRGPLPHPTILIDPTPWERLGASRGARGETGKFKLTRGVVAVCWALTQVLPGSRVILVGFDNVHAQIGLSPEAGFPDEYRDLPSTFPFRNYKGGSTKYGNHDYAAERPLIEYLAAHHQVIVQFAEDVWSLPRAA